MGLSADYKPPGSNIGYPLFGTITKNLGRARYEGLEFGIQNAPEFGWGFVIQGAFTKAYPYGLPPDFYCSNVPANKCTPLHYNTNLGIIPGINFQASGPGWNTINGVSVPYSQGYADINYRTQHGSFYAFGTTYYGSNNTYSLPAFWVFNATARFQLRLTTAFQVRH